MSNSNLQKRLDRLLVLVESLGFRAESKKMPFGLCVTVWLPGDQQAVITLNQRSLGILDSHWGMLYDHYVTGRGADCEMHEWIESFAVVPDNVIPFAKP